MNQQKHAFRGFNNQPPPLILIVDDLSENLTVLGTILRLEGYQIAIANNGKQAVSITAARKPDLILLDIAMPEMDGLTACRLIKEDPEVSHIPVIFLTARTETEDLINGFEAGAVDYITKPFKSAELLVRVSTHLELKQSRDLILSQKSELTHLLATRDKLFSIVSHDLRSPFSGLLTLANLLVENFESYSQEDLQDSLRLIRDTSDQLHTLIQNLLNWAKLQSDSTEINPSRLQLRAQVRKSTDILALNSTKKAIRFIEEIPETVHAMADPNMLRIILHNLLGNSIKFSHPGGIVNIIAEQNGSFIKVSIIDYGTGMSDEKLNDLFRPGRNVSTSGTAKEPGTGLGLLLCKEMVEKLGGKIAVESVPGKGSTFWFTLPAA